MNLQIIKGYLDYDENVSSTDEVVQKIFLEQEKDLQTVYDLITKDENFILKGESSSELVCSEGFLAKIKDNTLRLVYEDE